MSTLTQAPAAESKPDNIIRFRADDELYERVRIEAIKRRTSVQQLCVEAMNAYLISEDSNGSAQ